MSKLENFMELFNAPDFIASYIHFFVSKKEMDLVVEMGRNSLTQKEIVALIDNPADNIEPLLEECYQKEILNKEIKDNTIYYSISSFYRRLDNFCKFGNYTVIPKKIRHRLDEWCLGEYQKEHDHFKKILAADPGYENCHNDLILLLDEAEACIDTVDEIKLVPCNCKMMADQCEKPREVCLIFDKSINDRSGGRSLTKEEAKKLIRMADKAGLMHTVGPYNWKEAGPSAMCNCCACCCYPFRSAQQLGTKGKWPASFYAANYDQEKCISCGLCTRRCFFQAFFFDGTDTIDFNPELCWGCGLCANSCPTGAIIMKRLDGEPR